MAFIQNPTQLYTRVLTVEIILAQGNFTVNRNNVGNTLIVNQLNKQQNNNANNQTFFTVSATIDESLTNQMSYQADVSILGLANDTIAQISTLGQPMAISGDNGNGFGWQLNTINIYAGYSLNSNSLIYTGNIIKAFVDKNDKNRPLHLQCMTNFLLQQQPATATNPNGNVSVASLFSNFANQLKYSFNNNGVNGFIDSPVLQGSTIEQIKQLANIANVSVNMTRNTLSIAPINTEHYTQVIDLDYTSGLLGYPVIDQWGIMLNMRFNPKLQLGQQIKVTSQVPYASGVFFVYSIYTQLENNGENWKSAIRCASLQFANQVTGGQDVSINSTAIRTRYTFT